MNEVIKERQYFSMISKAKVIFPSIMRIPSIIVDLLRSIGILSIRTMSLSGVVAVY